LSDQGAACAIVGLAARLPGGASARRFWDALEGQDTFIRLMPAARRRLLFPGSPEMGGAAEYHGMFLDDVDAFDRRLFGISPPGAMFADPRQRLLLESCWAALEDAGLRAGELAGRRVGVFVAQDAWYWGSYADTWHADYPANQEFVLPGNNPTFLANRVSSVFGLHGPSLVFNTTCSSVFVALHHAREALLRGECEYALVGGVTVMHRPPPDRFESPTHAMHSFSAQADGYVSSEGCGAFVLRRADAEARRRHAIHALVSAAGCNSGGRTQSFAQPSRVQLVELLRETLVAAGLRPEQVNYIEAHGIASSLGDAVEANALGEVFGAGGAAGACHVSTIKPNIGHAHAASGVYSLVKAILAFRYERIPPIRGMAGARLNEAIEGRGAGLRFASEAMEWPRSSARERHVLLPSFGFSNVNAAVVLREPPASESRPARAAAGAGVAVCLSARTQDRLQAQIERLHEVVAEDAGSRAPALDLAEVACTLQTGREAFEVRLAAVVDSLAGLERVLAAARCGECPPGAFRGAAPRSAAADLTAAIEAAVEARDTARLAELWAAGAAVPWVRCWGDEAPRSTHLPAYPFARERYWLPAPKVHKAAPPRPATAGAVGRALALQDTSTPQERRFTTRLTGEEFFFSDHRVKGQPVLPATAYLELADAALRALARPAGAAVVRLRNTTWLRPLVITGQGQDLTVRFPDLRGEVTLAAGRPVRYEVCTGAGDAPGGEVVHASGVVELRAAAAPERLDAGAIRAALTLGTIGADECYRRFSAMGLVYGPSHRGIESIDTGDGEALAKLRLPADVLSRSGGCTLHPGLLDSALQTFIALDSAGELLLPYALDELDVIRALEGELLCRVRAARSASSKRLRKFDLELADASGEIVAKLRGFSLRAPAGAGAAGVETRKPAPPAPAAAPPAARSRDARGAEVFGHVRAALASAFRLESVDVSPETTFRDLGMDSLLAATATKELERHFGFLPRTLFFEYETVGELSDFLQAQRAERADPAPAAVSAPAGPEARDALVDKAAVVAGSDLDRRLEQLGAQRLQNSVLFEMWPQLYLSPRGYGCLHVARRGDRVFATGQGYARHNPNEDALVEEFAAYCAARGLTLGYLGMDGRRGPAFESRTGMVSLPVGCFQTLESLADFTLAGTSMSRLRYMVQRFRKIADQKTVEYRGGDRATDDAIRAVVLAWSRAKQIVTNVDVLLRDMGAGLLTRRHRVFLTSIGASLQNAIMILPVEGGYLMDQEYYLPDMPLGGTESAVVHILETLRAEGQRKFSLGLTWGLFDDEGADAGSDRAGREFLAHGSGPVANMLRNGRQNRQHKNKYRPSAHGVYFYRRADSDPALIEKSLGEFVVAGRAADEVEALVRASSQAQAAGEACVVAPAPEPRPSAAAAGGELALDLATDSWSHFEAPFTLERMDGLRRSVEAQAGPSLERGLLAGRPHVLTTSGRLAERLFFRAFRSRRRRVLQSVLFETTLHHEASAGFEPVEIPDPRVFETRSSRVFRGGIDLERLRGALGEGRDEIGLVYLELCNNAAGGYPVSLDELRSVARLAREHGVPLALDVTRIVRNAELIRRYEPGQAARSVWAIVDELMDCATYAIGSLSKDFALDVGGVIASREPELIQRAAAFGRLEGGLASPKQERLIAAGLAERDYVETKVREQLDLSARVHAELARRGASVVQPGGGHCILVRADEAPDLEREEQAQAALLSRLEAAGIRGGAHLTGRLRDTALNRCVRLALPLGLPADGVVERLVAALAPARGATAPAVARPSPDARRGEGRRDVAIIGMWARFPDAPDLRAYWRNLASGTASLREIPPWRWDWREHFEPDPLAAVAQGKAYGKWGAFVDDAERFDPLFFGIAPKDAEAMDPQERVFLEAAWAALEDAGYGAGKLRAGECRRTGVFAGVTNAVFDDGGGPARQCSFARLVNRVSYHLDLGGPSLALDNLCSSSAVAVHEACEYIRSGRGDLALAGAVNLNLNPGVYAHRSREGLLSRSARCAAFEKGGEGYVPGEGVGVLVLKDKHAALRDRDHVYAVVRGSAVNHSGKMNAFGAANPRRQAAVISEALASAGVDPRSVSYIEAAAAGVELSDAIELSALQAVFGGRGGCRGAYAIGSVKPNIGHCEAAAGLSQIVKAVLCLAHRQLVPTLVSGELTPDVDFTRFPFRLQRSLTPWEPVEVDGHPVPRRAGVTTIGAAGVNAHLLLEEHETPSADAAGAGPALVVLSARTAERLRAYVERWIAYLEAPGSEPGLADVAYTLQVGRDELAHRLAVIASDPSDLLAQLRAWRESGRATRSCRQGEVEAGAAAAVTSPSEAADLAQIAALWTSGARIDWQALHRGAERRRVAGLPTYPFARRDCGGLWRPAPRRVEPPAAVPAGRPSVARAPAGERPALHANGTVRREIRALAGRILGLGPEDELGARTSFADMGFDSLKLTALVRELNLRFELNLARTAPFDFPDVEALAAHVSAELGAREAAPPAAAVRTEVPDLASILDDFVSRRVGLDETLGRLNGAGDEAGPWSTR
jgi:acyl transferase domain-containing protein